MVTSLVQHIWVGELYKHNGVNSATVTTILLIPSYSGGVDGNGVGLCVSSVNGSLVGTYNIFIVREEVHIHNEKYLLQYNALL